MTATDAFAATIARIVKATGCTVEQAIPDRHHNFVPPVEPRVIGLTWATPGGYGDLPIGD